MGKRGHFVVNNFSGRGNFRGQYFGEIFRRAIFRVVILQGAIFLVPNAILACTAILGSVLGLFGHIRVLFKSILTHIHP